LGRGINDIEKTGIVQPFNFLIVTNSIIALKLHLSQVRESALYKPSEMMAFLLSIIELG
jgi:hypothetical protein